jgi:hypothetical protein
MPGYIICMIYPGACHCEAIGFTYETALAPEAWPVRACACRFCRTHGAATTSDPGGALELSGGESAQLLRYQFGLRTAEFWLCRGCGVYLAAVTSDGRVGIINTNALLDRPTQLPPPTSQSYDGETAAGRIQRRHERWTPIRAAGSPRSP